MDTSRYCLIFLQTRTEEAEPERPLLKWDLESLELSMCPVYKHIDYGSWKIPRTHSKPTMQRSHNTDTSLLTECPLSGGQLHRSEF